MLTLAKVRRKLQHRKDGTGAIARPSSYDIYGKTVLIIASAHRHAHRKRCLAMD